MIKKLLTLIIIIGGLSAKAQQTHHITVDATYFNPATLEFYKPRENASCLLYRLNIVFNNYTNEFEAGPLDTGTINLDRYFEIKNKSINDLVLLPEIKKGKTGYDKKVTGFTYRSLPKTDGDKNYFTTFNVVDTEYFLITGHRGIEDKSGDYTYSHNTDYKRFTVVVINNCITLYIASNCPYHVVNYNGQFDLYYNGDYQKTWDGKPNETLIKNTYPAGETFQEKGKTGLMAYQSNKALIPAQYDSLFYEWLPFIVAYKKDKPHIFYHTGEEVKIKKLRAVCMSYDISVLAGNKVSLLSPDGNLTDSLPEKIICEGASFEMERIYKKDGNYILSKHVMEADSLVTKELILGSDTTFSNISLITGDARINFNTRYILAETPDGKKGIISPAENGYTTVINFDYQEINGCFSNLLRIDTKKGLSGYYPLNKEPKYSRLAQFDRGFARFTLPNGKQGWLAHNGTEYLDE